MSAFPFLLIASDGAVLTRIAADSLADARAILRPTPEQSVRSAASHALPLPKALARDTCLGCGVRPKVAPYDYCAECRRRRRNDQVADAKARRGAAYGNAVRAVGKERPAKKARSQSRHRPGYWRDYFADPARRERRNAARRAQRRAA